MPLGVQGFYKKIYKFYYYTNKEDNEERAKMSKYAWRLWWTTAHKKIMFKPSKFQLTRK